MRYVKFLFVNLAVALFVPGALAAVSPEDLRCEYLRDPLGIDVRAPRLSWEVAAPDRPAERGQCQTAYHILVADDAALLRQGTGNLWDSGKVASAESLHVPYQGVPLTSRMRCYWTVRVWDRDGQPSAWSAPARWTMGLLEPSDWSGQWIGLDETPAENILKPLANAQWIWAAGVQAEKSAPIGEVFFRQNFDIPAGKNIVAASAAFTADNSYILYINGQRAGRGTNYNDAPSREVRSLLAPGRNVLAVKAGNAGDAPNPAGMIGSLKIEFSDGEVLEVVTNADWRAADAAPDEWLNADFDVSGWAAPQELGAYGIAPWNEVGVMDSRVLSARYLRREFQAEKAVRSATASICGLGLFELEINGKKAGQDVLVPALTDYDGRAFYLTYDVTDLVQAGDNAVGVALGNGRYYAPRSTVPTGTRTFGFPSLMFSLRLEYEDGSVEDIVSGTDWKLTDAGPIRANNEYDGEIYDARMELTGWSTPGYDDGAWRAAQPAAAPGGVLSAQMTPPIRVVETIRPKSMKELYPGVFIYDMGQNMVGWCQLRVEGPAGTQVRLRHAETLKEDGSLYMDNLRSAKCEDRYTLKGGGPEVYTPRFTYHGFRFVELSGFPGTPSLDSIEGQVVHDALDETGTFVASKPLLNALHSNIKWGIRGNYRSFPTDCPQRDERQAWLGDRSAECFGESCLHDIAPLYAKWMQDIEDSQKESGSVSDVSPSYWPLYNDNVTWPSTFVIAPSMLYRQYGDLRVIEARYEGMKRWIEHMNSYLEDGVIEKDNYGDWCVPPESPELIHSKDPARKTSPVILACCYFYYDLTQMAKYAGLLGKTQDAADFERQAEALKAAFNAKVLNPETKLYDNGTQTSCVLPLAMGLAPEDAREALFAHLVDSIEHKTDNHIGTGLIGGQWLMRTLSDGGRADLAYTLATQESYPSWGYMAKHGATTVWELWNGDTADPAMNSGNHVMLVGDLLTWFYEYLGGIRPAAPGFTAITVKPYVLGDLDAIDVTMQTPCGLAASKWTRSADGLEWEVRIPANTTATLCVPCLGRKNAAITESGKAVWKNGAYVEGAPGIHGARMEDGWVAFDAGSGVYHFTLSGAGG